MSFSTCIALLVGALATALLTLLSGWHTVLLGLVVTGSLSYLAVKLEGTRRQLGELHRLRAAYDQLDQQAKLIIRTDLELHRMQEELDRRLASLMSLHHLGRQLQVSLRPEEVFSKLDAAVVTKFGFSKGLLGMCPSRDTLEWGSFVGIGEPIAEQLNSHLLTTGLLKQILAHPAPQSLDHASAIEPTQRKLLDLLGVPSAVVAGIIPHAGPSGLLVLGRAGGVVADPRADEELVAILANQLATAVENCGLYKEAWSAQQELERKVQQRTHELAEVNTKLIQLNKAKSDFVSAVSHELRTPLSAIKGYASLLRSGQFGPLVVAQGERLAKIEKHVDLLTQFINNLLDIARIESGRTAMEHREIPAEEFLATIHDLVRPQLEAKHLRYAVDLDGVKHLMGDPEQLRRVFLNLLSNAVKYTPEKGSVGVSFEREGATIVVRVSDTGCGMPPDDLPKLFQEFYRANDPINQQVRGTGLGLALVKRIVEAHQGHITVQSTLGKGTTFTVQLPAG